MKNSISKIYTILKKDIKVYWVLMILFITIPVIVFYIPSRESTKTIKICIVSNTEAKSELHFKDANIVYSSKLEDGLIQLKNKKVDAVVSLDEKVVYSKTKDLILLSKIKEGLTMPGDIQVKVEILNINEESPNNGISYLLCSIVIIMIGLIGGPIVFLDEKSDGTYSSLMLSPLTYFEFIISKGIFGFLCTFTSLVTFLMITQEITKNTFALLCMIFISSVFISIFSGILSIPFKSVPQMTLVSSPIMIVWMLFELLNFNSNDKYSLYLPIQYGFKRVLVTNELPLQQMAVIAGASLILLMAYLYLLRRYSRIQV
jgi:DNA-dependent RNA polymerase auxiliary subunit epsilon